MNELMKKKNEEIENLIYEIRGKQIMIDSDLARLYGCKNGTKDGNKAVNRNIDRFPEDFYFQLTREEYDNLKFQNGTSRLSSHGGVRKLPYVFTEQGVAMLASVLRTEIASKISVSIMRTFALMKHYISGNLIEQKYINNQVMKNSEDIKLLQESFARFDKKRSISEIYFNGQIYDAYSKILEIFKEAEKELIIIDAYADNVLLNIIKRLDISITLITKKDNLSSKQDILKYKKQYHNLKVIYDNTFHDRYFILDNNIVYHCGASINRIGYKTFSINLINDKDVCDMLKSRIKEIV